MQEIDARYARLLSQLKDIARINAARNALEWDMETKMPAGAGEARGEIIGSLAGLAHAKLTSPSFEEAIVPLRELREQGRLDRDDPCHAIIGLAWKEFDRARRLPSAFVEELEGLCAASHHVWAEARKASDWNAFLPNLSRIIAMKRDEARLVGYSGSPYDALIDRFEPGMTSAMLGKVLGDLAAFLAPFVRRIGEAGPVDPSVIRKPLPARAQEALCLRVAKAIGFDMAGGRLDEAAHPFMTRLHPGDVRLVTRYDEANLLDGLYSVIHEAGHGMYEQGLPAGLYGTPAGEAPSYGLHESQSRLWENMVGRSLQFCEWLLGECALQGAAFGTGHVPFWRAINAVAPSLVRVDADEVTYNLHVCLRYGIERDLIERKLDPADVPEAWNAGMRELLGVTVPDDARGCLQDVHWSGGLFGYFPSYAVGNLYAAQLYAAAAEELPGMEEGFAEGEFAPLLDWLRQNVHERGSLASADAIVREATGSGLDAGPFARYLEDKYAGVYGI
ncbi:MAG TPA: carboxypeptidase M32 [Candidatus Binatia bacterium]|nr:carboxypeptidase M32 [Candidatus Binatia bacterium]